MVRAVDERANTGSVSMVNSDVLEERDAVERWIRAAVGQPDRCGAGVPDPRGIEGPEGRASLGQRDQRVDDRRGARRPRTKGIVARLRPQELSRPPDRSLSDEGLSFGFADLQAKVRYDVSPRHSATMTFIAGDSRLREIPQQADESDLFVGNNASAIAIGSWRTTSAGGSSPPPCWRHGTSSTTTLWAASESRGGHEPPGRGALGSQPARRPRLSSKPAFWRSIRREFQRKQRLTGADRRRSQRLSCGRRPPGWLCACPHLDRQADAVAGVARGLLGSHPPDDGVAVAAGGAGAAARPHAARSGRAVSAVPRFRGGARRLCRRRRCSRSRRSTPTSASSSGCPRRPGSR